MKKILFFCSTTFVLASCMAPRVVTRLTPEAPEGHYEMGREYISLSSDSITAELAFDGIHQDHLVFDFVVVNHTSSSLSVHPTAFYYVILDSALADSSKLPPRMAVHPERILHQYEETLEEWSGEKELNAVLGFVDAGIGMILNTTAFFATEDPGYIADAILGTLGKTGHYVAVDHQISQDITLIKDEKEIVQEEIFRSVTLPPGEVASGYVYFPQDHDARYCMFCFPVDNQLFQFVYHQQHEVLLY
ncbi:MAG TPA: hypothetical protein ENO20_01855 [Bacteroides sp.]|nr:hypothetical protein [Bacteroides sp.]